MTFGSNLLIFRKKKRLTQEQLAEKIGASKQMVSNWEQDKNMTSQKYIDKLSRVLEVPISAFYKENLTSDTKFEEDAIPYLGKERYKNPIPFYDAVVVGGTSVLADQTSISAPVEMIDPGTFLRNATGTIRVYGHSMFPKYPAGCIVAFRESDRDIIHWGEDYVIELSDRRILKRLEKSEDKTLVCAVSYNKSEDYAYAPIDIPITKIKRLYMVLGKIEIEASI